MTTSSNALFHLDEEFYPRSAVRQALADFSEFLSGELSSDGGTIQLQLSALPEHAVNEATIIHEFLNYALDLALKRRYVGRGGEPP